MRIVVLLSCLFATPVFAQGMDMKMDHDMAGMDMGAMHHGMAMHGLFGSYGMSREGSGTSWQPEAAPHAAIHLAADDWMAGYRDAARVAEALDRMAEFRLRRPNPLAGSGEELLRDYAGFEADFTEFLPDAAAFAESVRRARG